MTKLTKPDYTVRWASLGDNTKPLDSYIEQGWLAVKPPRQYFNWLDNRQDNMLAYVNQAGIPEWDNGTDYEGAFSYAQGSDNQVYRCIADNGPGISGANDKDPTDQPANAAFWELAFGTAAASAQNAEDISDLRDDYEVGAAITDPAAWRTAISAVGTGQFTGSNQSLVTNGFQKLPGGLIIQWGTNTVAYDETDTAIVFPTAFPTGCLNVTATVKSTGPSFNGVRSPQVHTFSTTGFTIFGEVSNVASAALPTCWIAIGY